MVLVADITMSLDNILAVAALSHNNIALLIAGLGLSISFVVFTSSMLSKMMERFPVLIWIGAGILGRVAGEMIVTDPWVRRTFNPSGAVTIAATICGAALVLLAGWTIRRMRRKKRLSAAVSSHDADFETPSDSSASCSSDFMYVRYGKPLDWRVSARVRCPARVADR